jgi:alkyl hydroperoxide reductase subunit D
MIRLPIGRSCGLRQSCDFSNRSAALWSLDGCGACVDSHEKVPQKAGVAAAMIQAAMRFAAIMQSVAVALEAGVASLPIAGE